MWATWLFIRDSCMKCTIVTAAGRTAGDDKQGECNILLATHRSNTGERKEEENKSRSSDILETETDFSEELQGDFMAFR